MKGFKMKKIFCLTIMTILIMLSSCSNDEQIKLGNCRELALKFDGNIDSLILSESFLKGTIEYINETDKVFNQFRLDFPNSKDLSFIDSMQVIISSKLNSFSKISNSYKFDNSNNFNSLSELCGAVNKFQSVINDNDLNENFKEIIMNRYYNDNRKILDMNYAIRSDFEKSLNQDLKEIELKVLKSARNEMKTSDITSKGFFEGVELEPYKNGFNFTQKFRLYSKPGVLARLFKSAVNNVTNGVASFVTESLIKDEDIIYTVKGYTEIDSKQLNNIITSITNIKKEF